VKPKFLDQLLWTKDEATQPGRVLITYLLAGLLPISGVILLYNLICLALGEDQMVLIDLLVVGGVSILYYLNRKGWWRPVSYALLSLLLLGGMTDPQIFGVAAALVIAVASLYHLATSIFFFIATIFVDVLLYGTLSVWRTLVYLSIGIIFHLIAYLNHYYYEQGKKSEEIALANLELEGRVDEATKALEEDIQKRKEVEEALREREQHLELLIDNIIDVVWQMDLRLKFTYVSPSIFPMTGYTQEEWIGTNLSQHATGKEYFKMARQALSALKNYHEFQHIIIRAVMLKKDGQEIPVEIIGKLLLDQNGLPKGFQGTTRDITARARAEEQVEEHLTQLQALREIERAINSTLEADQILNIMMTELEQLVPYDSISVQMLEDDCLRIVACRGITHAEEIKETLSFPLLPTFPNHQVIKKGEPVTFADITREYPHFMEEEYTTVMGHVRSWLGIPLVVKGKSIGMFTLDRYQVLPFTEDEIQAVQSFANRAAIALENARLFGESQRRADEFRTLYEIGHDVAGDQDLNHLLKSIAKKAKELLAVEISWVYLHDPKRDDLEMAAIEGQINGYEETVGARMDIGNGVVGRVAQAREMITIEDYRVWEERQPKYVRADFTSVLSVPMLYAGELVGVLVVSDVAPKVRRFTQDEKEILSLFATSAAGAVHSARLFSEIQQHLNQLESLRTIDKAISGILDRDLMLRILLAQIVTQLKADASCVLLYNPHLYILEYAVGHGFKSEARDHITLRLGEGYTGKAARQRQIIQVGNIDEQKPGFLESPHLEGEDFHTYFGLPLIAKGQLTGVLEVFHRSPFRPDKDWLDYLDTLAGQVAIAIDNINMFRGLQQAHQELDLAYDQTLKGWAHALEYRDMETEGHSRRVTNMTVSLARVLGIQGKKLVQVRRGALLHDIGKMAVPDDILQKPGSLDEREWQIMRQHPVYAYEMLKSIDYLRPALDIPYCHHEKWDGSGYPRGLKGEQIPLAARIFAVVDVWDALTSDRPYREAWPEQKALNHIRQQAGKHFDPQVVDGFFEILETLQD